MTENLESLSDRVFVRKTFAQFLLNGRKILLLLRKMFARNNSTLRNFAQKSFSTKCRYTAFAQPCFANSAISQCSFYIMIHFLEKKVSRPDLTVIFLVGFSA